MEAGWSPIPGTGHRARGAWPPGCEFGRGPGWRLPASCREGVEKRFQSGVSCANLTPGGEVKRNKAAVRHKAQVLLLAAMLQRCRPIRSPQGLFRHLPCRHA